MFDIMLLSEKRSLISMKSLHMHYGAIFYYYFLNEYTGISLTSPTILDLLIYWACAMFYAPCAIQYGGWYEINYYYK